MSPGANTTPARVGPKDSSAPQPNTSAMTSPGASQESSSLRRPLSQVQTVSQTTAPGIGKGASSVASGSQYASPIMPSDNAVLTSHSSIQPSPDIHRAPDVEGFPPPPPPLALGDPLLRDVASDLHLSRKPSSNSMSPSMTPSTGSMAEALQSTGSKNLIRRLSSRARQGLANRRQSSVAPKSRDTSIGPGIIRRRSDSTNTNPPDSVFFTDSDDDFTHDERDEFYQSRVVSSTSNLGSGSAGTTTPVDPSTAPRIPLALIKGTWMNKVSKKRRYKRIFLVLDREAAKITWYKNNTTTKTPNKATKCVYIDDIKEIRLGSDIRQYCLDYDVAESDEGRFFSILHAVPDKSKSKVMHLIAEDEETFNNWVTALDAISKHRQDLMTSLMSFNDKAVKAYWTSEMSKQFGIKPHSVEDEEIDLAGVERVCQNLHIHVSQKQIHGKFAIADSRRNGRLNYAEFQVFVREMRRRPDIRALYRELASDVENGITWPEFATFLRETQSEDVDSHPHAWESTFVKFSHRLKPRDDEAWEGDHDMFRMDEQALSSYLTSTFNLPHAREPSEYTLDRPMNEYFISSSHNTYLLGRQVADMSSVEGYIAALVRGCRSVEIDCWDGNEGQPIVQHGYALTNAISFREVIFTINKYAFYSNHWPLWVSLEVHCNSAQQIIMAKTMREIFGASLVTELLDASADKLPSPSELKDRILVKVKAASVDENRQGRVADTNGRRRGNSVNSPYAKPVVLDNSVVPQQHLSQQSPMISPRDPSRRRVGKRYDTITEGEVQDGMASSSSDGDSSSEDAASGKRTSKIVPQLGELGVYCSGVKFEGFAALDCKLPFHILSFMEGTFRNNTKSKEYKDALYRHNMRYMMRVYPQFSRFSSNNFNPLMYWRKGVQMAALNWQTPDLGMQLNQAMFTGGTDQSGYVLKPHSMREIRVLPNGLPEEARGKLQRQNITFCIDVISAQQLMRPGNLPDHRTLDPYVEVEVFHANDKRDKHDSSVGIPTPTDTPLKYRTQIVRENGFNPVFDAKFKFNVTTKFPELVFVKFSVKTSMDGQTCSDRVPPMASYMAKLSNLKQGYRTLPLLDSGGDRYLFSTLFCRIQIGPVTDVYVPKPDEGVQAVGKLKALGNKVFSRSSTNNSSSSANDYTKLGPEKSAEKSSLDSGYSDVASQQSAMRPV